MNDVYWKARKELTDLEILYEEIIRNVDPAAKAHMETNDAPGPAGMYPKWHAIRSTFLRMKKLRQQLR